MKNRRRFICLSAIFFSLLLSFPLFLYGQSKSSQDQKKVQMTVELHPMPAGGKSLSGDNEGFEESVDNLPSFSSSLPVCGNSQVEYPEDCDDGAQVSGDGCSSDCILERCGDGTLQNSLGEECDDGNFADGDGCSGQCLLEQANFICGDGILESGEQCEGHADCEAGFSCIQCSCERGFRDQVLFCGDGILDGGEECDDGNPVSFDGCSSDCEIEECGDGIVQIALGESCDDGNSNSEDGCSDTCENETCGDGVRQEGLGEQCDDGNLAAGDGCDASCKRESSQCPSGSWCTVQEQNGQCAPATDCVNSKRVCSGQACKEGGCDEGLCCQCQNSCGDSIEDAWEECDDGNQENGDGCSSTCTIESCDLNISCDTPNVSGIDASGSCSLDPSPPAGRLAVWDSIQVLTNQICESFNLSASGYNASYTGQCKQTGTCRIQLNTQVQQCSVTPTTIEIPCVVDETVCGSTLPIENTCEAACVVGGDPGHDMGAYCDGGYEVVDGKCECLACESCVCGSLTGTPCPST